MESTPPPPPSYQAGPDIPSDIFQPLLLIAQRQYEANDVKSYYVTMLRHLRRMGTQNADAAYTLMTPVSDRKVSFSNNEDSIVQITSGVSDSHVSPKTIPPIPEPTFEPSYEPGQSDQLAIGSSSHSAYPILDDSISQMEVEMPPPQPPRRSLPQQTPHQQSILMMAAGFGPAPRSLPMAEQSQSNLHATSAEQPPYNLATQPVQTPWYPSAGMNALSSPPMPQQQQPLFAPPFPSSQQPYGMPMHNNSMPLLIPYENQQHPQQPQQMYHHSPEQESFFGPLSNSLGLSQLASDLYLPMIDVIPSRKRRKALQKGVRRITQSIPLPRQTL